LTRLTFNPTSFGEMVEFSTALGLIFHHGMRIPFISNAQLMDETMAVTGLLGVSVPNLKVSPEKVVEIIRQMESDLDEKEIARLQELSAKARRQLGVG
jgi:hypothetical protein